MTKFVGLRVKLYSYLIDDSSEDKKLTELENKINYLEKNKFDTDNIKKIVKNS